MKKICSLLLLFPLLTFCTNGNKVNAGFGSGDITASLASALEAEKEQKEEINISVFIGHNKGFFEHYVKKVISPQFDVFVFGIERIILADDVVFSKELLNLNLDDFSDNQKYSFTVNETLFSNELSFNFSFEDKFLSECLPNIGRLCYDFCLLNSEHEILDFELTCGVNKGRLFFENNNGNVIFH